MTEPPVTEALVELIAYLGRALRSTTAVGHPAPAVARLSARMNEPKPGDLVMETSHIGRFDPDGVGRLVRIEYAENEPGVVERYVVEPLHRPGEEQGWRNADFIALPNRRDADGWTAS